MTGIEILHEFVAGINPLIVVCGVTKTAYDREHMDVAGDRLRDFLAHIANQIDRELEEERDRWDEELCESQMDKTRVMSVYLEMNKHVLGHEGMEDSPVARWARELREAMDGRDEEVTDVATIRKDAMEAYEWMREHGGLDSVKKLLDWVVGHCSTKQQLDFDFWLSGRVMHELGFDEDMADRDEVERRLLARLMPEGTQWPCFEDGKPVRIGDEISWRDEGGVVNSIELQDGGYFTLHAADGAEDWILPQYLPGERVRRPAPKVLDADGVEVCVGDTVYHVKDGSEMTVYGIEGEWLVVSIGGRVRHDVVTHRAPVLAADGRPLREGETVWHVKTGERFVVGAFVGGCVNVSDGRGGGWQLLPSQLTHECPDSWERLEEDAGKNPFDYCKDFGHTCENSEAYKAHDLVRRAKALAERGQ